MEYATDIYSVEKKPIKLDIEYNLNGEIINVIAYNNLELYDVRRGGYQLFLKTDQQLLDNDIDSLTKTIFAYKNDTFNFIIPKYVDTIHGKTLNVGFSLLELLQVCGGSMLYSNYPSNFIQTKSLLNNGSIQMTEIEPIGFVDALQEVQKISYLSEREITPTFNLLNYGSEQYILTKNILKYKEYGPSVYIIPNLIRLTKNIGYVIFQEKIIIWFVSLHYLVDESLDENVVVVNPGEYTPNPDECSFLKAMKKFNILTKVQKSGDESIFTEDNKSQILAFSGQFPCDLVDNNFEEMYSDLLFEAQ